MFIFSFESSQLPPRKCSESFVYSRHYLSEILLIYKIVYLFVCLFVCLFFSFESSWDTSRKIVWKFRNDWTWWDIVDLKNVYLFVGLFAFMYFNLNHLGIPPGKFSESFIWIGQDLAEIFFVCLFVFVCFHLNHLWIPPEIYSECFVKIKLDLAEILGI